ncbi:MFS transporter [Xanthomonas fragariae]|uniref:MFS transporter n=1 Tax=Xanthomonas fragariae TaxID=48664 RepID=UPI001ABE8E3E|nr:MFS transporter [Xanthomonas fragariae]UKR51871.1 MFS transporter [Xanthomonas fragariae]WAT13956.1 MFS transporter [Xanthomonas fragariae]
MQSAEANDDYLNFLFGKQSLAVWTMCLGVGLHSVNWNIVSTTAPTMVNDLGNARLISWITLIYLATSVVFGAYAAYVKRQIGARTAMILFAVVFGIGSFIVSAAPTMQVVLLGRAFQGIGEGLILALSYGVAQDVFSSKATPKLFGLFAFVYAFSAALGPVFAGFVTEISSWRVAFTANILFALIYIVMAWRSIPNKTFAKGDYEMSVPFLRLGLIGGAIMLVGFTDSVISALTAVLFIALAAVLFYACLRIDSKQSIRVFPAQIFTLTSTVGVGFWVVFLLPISLAGIYVFIPLYTQTYFGVSIIIAGYFSTIIAFSWSFGAIVTGSFKSGNWQSTFILMGTVGQFIGAMLFFTGYYFDVLWLILLGLFITGASLGTCWAFVTQRIVTATSEGDEDLAASQVPVVQTIATAVGAGIVGTLASFNGLTEKIPSATTLKAALLPVFSIGVLASAIGALFGLWLVFRKKEAVQAH